MDGGVSVVGRIPPVEMMIYDEIPNEGATSSLRIVTVGSENLFFCPLVPRALLGRVALLLPEDIFRKYYSRGAEDVLAEFSATHEDPEEILERAAREKFLNPNLCDRDYAVYSRVTCGFIGVGIMEAGFLPEEDVPGSYQAAKRTPISGIGSAELCLRALTNYPEMDVCLLYQEVISTLLATAQTFIGMELFSKRVIIPHIQSESSGSLPSAKEQILRGLCGDSLGVLLPSSLDKRNDSVHPQVIYGYEAETLRSMMSQRRMPPERCSPGDLSVVKTVPKERLFLTQLNDTVPVSSSEFSGKPLAPKLTQAPGALVLAASARDGSRALVRGASALTLGEGWEDDWDDADDAAMHSLKMATPQAKNSVSK